MIQRIQQSEEMRHVERGRDRTISARRSHLIWCLHEVQGVGQPQTKIRRDGDTTWDNLGLFVGEKWKMKIQKSDHEEPWGTVWTLNFILSKMKQHQVRILSRAMTETDGQRLHYVKYTVLGRRSVTREEQLWVGQRETGPRAVCIGGYVNGSEKMKGNLR